MRNQQKGFMAFIILVLGITMVVGIAIFSLNMQSRETFFLVHYYYLDSAREQLAKSAQEESHDWIKTQMQSSKSAARKLLLKQIHKFEDFTVNLDDTEFIESLANSKKIAEFVGFDINAKVHFKYLQPFFGKPESTKYDSDGLIFPHDKECRGIFTIEIEITKDGVSSKAYEAWYNFRFINILPPVVSRFSFFLKNQTKLNGFVGNINRLPFSNNKDKDHYKNGNRGIIETERSTVRPLVVINSLWDFQIDGQNDNRPIREFKLTDKFDNIDYKGWVFLGTNEPKGVILNLASHAAHNYEDDFTQVKVKKTKSSGKLYYGDFFHRQKGEEFKFSTRGELADANIAAMPKPYEDYEWGTELNFLMTSKLKNYASIYKSITYNKSEGEKWYRPSKRRIFYSYYGGNDETKEIDPSALTEMGFSKDADYRSQHPALIKPFGSYFYTKTPSRFFDNRSPTLILGPVRYSFMTVNSLKQESELFRQSPYEHNIKPKPITLHLPYINIDKKSDGVAWPQNNLTYDQELKVFNKKGDFISDPILIANDRESSYFENSKWALFADSGPDEFLLDTDAEDTMFYWEQMGSAVWLDSYLHAYNAMISNGGTNEGGNADNVLNLNDIKSLDSTIEVKDNDKFFFPDDFSESQIFNGNRLILSEFSNENLNYRRDLFKGKLGNLNLFSDSFKFDTGTGEMSADFFDLRFKASHVTDIQGFSQNMLKEGPSDTCSFKLDGIVYIHSTDSKDADEPEELRLGSDLCENKKLIVKGKGIIIYDHNIIIPNDLLIEGADELNSQRNKKSDSSNPFGIIDIGPVTIISVNGEIKIGNSVRELYAYLVALSETNGTISWETKPPDHDVTIIGGAAIHHLNLDQIDLLENDWINGTFGADKITSSKQNIFYKTNNINADGRLRIVFNNNFLPNVKENVDLHFNFVTSKGVHLVQ